jgi:DNA-binding Lrp family transcriptional regulator
MARARTPSDDELIRPLIAGNGEALELSELDRSLIRHLQHDGRRSFVQLASDLGVTEKTVRRHFEALQESNTLKIMAVAAPELLGYSAAAMLGICVDGAESASAIASSLVAHPRVDYVARAAGRYQILAELVAPDEPELMKTIEEEIMARPSVISCEPFPYLWVHYQQFDWEAAHRREPVQGLRPVAPPTIDDLDHRIVAALAADGRMPLARLHEIVGVSESIVRSRLRRLLDSNAVRIMALAHPSIMGLDLVAWLGIRAAPSVKLRDVAAEIVRSNATTFLVICGGRFDLFVEVVCADKRELLAVLDDQIRMIRGVDTVEVIPCADVQFKSLRPRS